jgi:hypothetical protein
VSKFFATSFCTFSKTKIPFYCTMCLNSKACTSVYFHIETISIHSSIHNAYKVWPLPAYDARCLLRGLEVLSNRRIVASARFAREILVGRVDCADLALMQRFEEVPCSRQRNAGLLTFFLN